MIIRIKLPKNLAHFLTYQSIIELRKLPLHGHHICLLKIQNFGLENLSFPVVRSMALTTYHRQWSRSRKRSREYFRGSWWIIPRCSREGTFVRRGWGNRIEIVGWSRAPISRSTSERVCVLFIGSCFARTCAAVPWSTYRLRSEYIIHKLADGSPVNGSAYSLLPPSKLIPDVFFSMNCATWSI